VLVKQTSSGEESDLQLLGEILDVVVAAITAGIAPYFAD
jgi:hypothetical protein